ncbi:hypothetical protein MNB_SV-5-1518 [hydrothermal vent metagenome]|uniref:Uncharacterized protein n=1 Tax=hydrothermal vent metagenome TaxID=652676 RepID=A0A1W1EER0_9ZZZZ
MKFLYISICLVTLLSADWTSDIVEKSNKIYNETKDKTILLYKENTQAVPLSKDEKMAKVWDSVYPDIEKSTEYIDKFNNAPESAWIGEDKEDIQKEINERFEMIINALIEDDLLVYKTKMNSLKKKISENKSNILKYREKRVGAPKSSSIYTTKSDFDDKISETKKENIILKNEIRIIKDKLKNNFKEIGVNLSSEQIDLLLTRVDGDDIIQISLVMKTLENITNQIMLLMKESKEELTQAKKYYGMHQVLLEMVVYIQQRYIDKCNNVYIPKIDKMIVDSASMMENTKRLKNLEEDTRRRAVYDHNLKAQALTNEVSILYKKDIISSKNKMIEAQKIAKDNLTLSKNTYETVMLSADLFALIEESKLMFEEVSKIQVPNLVPFENIQMEQKYKELTASLKK